MLARGDLAQLVALKSAHTNWGLRLLEITKVVNVSNWSESMD